MYSFVDLPGTWDYRTYGVAAKPEASEVKGDFFTLNSEDRLRLLQPIRTRELIKRPAYAVEQSLKGSKTRIFLKKIFSSNFKISISVQWYFCKI